MSAVRNLLVASLTLLAIPVAIGQDASQAASAAVPAAAAAAAAPAGASAAAQPNTLWRLMGIPQGFQKIRDVVANRRGNRPRMERKDPIKRIADPANLESDNPAIKAAAEVKKAEDMKMQKIKAIKYLATIGCGCYDKDGKITEALIAATDDCTPDVREASLEAIDDATSRECCRKCGSTSCCNEKITKRLSEIAYERDDAGCPIEPNAEVRALAKRILLKCCPGGPPSGPIEEDIPEKPEPEPIPVPEPEPTPEIKGESGGTEDAIQGESGAEDDVNDSELESAKSMFPSPGFRTHLGMHPNLETEGDSYPAFEPVLSAPIPASIAPPVRSIRVSPDSHQTTLPGAPVYRRHLPQQTSDQPQGVSESVRTNQAAISSQTTMLGQPDRQASITVATANEVAQVRENEFASIRQSAAQESAEFAEFLNQQRPIVQVTATDTAKQPQPRSPSVDPSPMRRKIEGEVISVNFDSGIVVIVSKEPSVLRTGMRGSLFSKVAYGLSHLTELEVTSIEGGVIRAKITDSSQASKVRLGDRAIFQ